MNQPRKLIDVSLFFNEFDLLQVRLETLYDIVDFFLVCEASLTFSGKPKSLMLGQRLSELDRYRQKLIYFPITSHDLLKMTNANYKQFRTPIDSRLPYKHGGKPPRFLPKSLRREIALRDASFLGLEKIADSNDLIVLSDADEIPSPYALERLLNMNLNVPCYFEMDWFLYWVNNKVNLPWYGSVAFRFDMIKSSSMDLMRYSSSNPHAIPGVVLHDAGWHLSYLGGAEAIREKIAALPYQGARAAFASLLARIGLRSWSSVLDCNSDLLFQGRSFEVVPIDDKFPLAIRNDLIFLHKYALGAAYHPLGGG